MGQVSKSLPNVRLNALIIINQFYYINTSVVLGMLKFNFEKQRNVLFLKKHFSTESSVIFS